MLAQGQAQLDWNTVMASQPDAIDANQALTAELSAVGDAAGLHPTPGTALNEYLQRLTATEARARHAQRGLWSTEDKDPAHSNKERLARVMESFGRH
jgi:endonuclease YncB( thermonuclease family)